MSDLSSLQNLKSIDNLYCLCGEETFMVEEGFKILKAQALGDGLADFNFTSFYAGDVSVEEIKNAVETLPMMSQRRVVAVKETQDLSASDLESLLPLIENPVDSTTLIFLASKIDSRKKFYKALESKGTVIKFPRLYENQIGPWIQNLAVRHGLKLGLDEIEFMKQFVGTSLADLNSELLKVAQYVGDRKAVTVDDLKAVVSRVKVENVFELVSAIGRGDQAEAFQQLAYLLDQGQNEIGLLALVIRHFRILLLAQEALREGLSQSQISSRVGVHGFFVKEYIEQSKRFSATELSNIYAVLVDTDRALKSSPLSSHIWLENLILRSCEK